MESLLKRRKELLQAKQDIEKKLKLANSNKKNVQTANLELESNSVLINKDIIVNEKNTRFTVKEMFWDNGRLGVLMDDKLVIKSFTTKHGPYSSLLSGDSKKSVLTLPEPFDQDATLLMDQGLLALSTASSNYLYHQNRWKIINSFESKKYKLHKILEYEPDKEHYRLIFLLNHKIFCIADWRGEKLDSVCQVSDVENIIKSKDSMNVLLVTRESLILCHPITLEQIHFANSPTNNTKSFYFDSKQICYFNYDLDATLFLVLADKLIGRLKIIVGSADSGFSEIESIPIPKDYLWFKVQNPLIIYQDSKYTIHILSLFTLEEEYKFELEHEIRSLVMIHSKILLFYTLNDEFLYIKLDKK